MSLSLQEVFGVRPTISEHSYVDRGALDETLQFYSQRPIHIAIRGESKSGKSWLRQKIFPDANIISCRIDTTVADIYRQILANLNISVEVSGTKSTGLTLRMKAGAEAGWKWLAKASGNIGADGEFKKETIIKTVGKDEFDFEFLSGIIGASERRVVIEDFHYLPLEQQRKLAHDLKSFWDHSAFFVVIGVWHAKNYIVELNSDLAGRIEEVNVDWQESELEDSIRKGGVALGVDFLDGFVKDLAKDSYNNIGIAQSLAYLICQNDRVFQRKSPKVEIYEDGKLAAAGMQYADQIGAVYLAFSRRTSDGIRTRKKNATQIYAHAMWAILEAKDTTFLNGISLDYIFDVSSARQPRIQCQNLKRVLTKLAGLQADENGKGVIVSFDEANEEVVLIDRSLLFYRKYMTVKWPWEEMVLEAEANGSGASQED